MAMVASKYVTYSRIDIKKLFEVAQYSKTI